MKINFNTIKKRNTSEYVVRTSAKQRLLKLTVVLYLFSAITNGVSSASLGAAICHKVHEENQTLLSEYVYKDLAENLEWDLGQDTLRGELAEENEKIMKCLFSQGFNLDNMEHCVGRNYDNVINAYNNEFDKTRHKFEDSVIGALKSKGYDQIASESFLAMETELKEALANNCNPEIALNTFENKLVGVVPTDMEHLEELKKRTHGHYLVYLSFKRLIRAYILLTISCIQNFLTISRIPLPSDFNYRLYSEDRIEEMFPDDEISKVYTKKKKAFSNDDESEDNSEIGNDEDKERTFNEDMVRQGRFKNVVAMNLAIGNIDPQNIKETDLPEKIYHDVVKPQWIENHRNKHNDEKLI